MIIAIPKPFDEIIDKIKKYNKILLLGCGGCVTVCHTGGEKEIGIMRELFELKFNKKNLKANFFELTLHRQCEPEFIEPLLKFNNNYDVILSYGCGVGVQFVGKYIENVEIIPALNTTFLGATEKEGTWKEYCKACGNCVLDYFGGICPITRCSKSLLNGPCGGSVDGFCEVNSEQPCAWNLIWEKLQKMGKTDNLLSLIKPKDYSVIQNGLNTYIRDDLILDNK